MKFGERWPTFDRTMDTDVDPPSKNLILVPLSLKCLSRMLF